MTKRILFFTAGKVPTVAEQAQIDALNAMTVPGYSVGVRNGAESAVYSDDNLEPCDFVAGTIPTAYNAKTDYGVAHASRPVKFSLHAAAVTLAVSATLQLQALKAGGVDVSALTLADVTGVSTTYASSDVAKATVDAAGIVTGVAAGAVTITATHTYATGKTIAATIALTVTA